MKLWFWKSRGWPHPLYTGDRFMQVNWTVTIWGDFWEVADSVSTSPPWAYPGHLTPFVGREGGNLITTHRGWGIWSLASMSCYEINHGGDGRDVDCKTVVCGRFRKAGSAVSVILECEACEPHTRASLAVFSLAPDLSFEYGPSLALVWGKSLTFCTRARSFARTNDAKIVRSRNAQCKTRESP